MHHTHTGSGVLHFKRALALLAGTVSGLILTQSASAGVLVNGNFESGLTGWTVSIDNGNSEFFGTTPAGTASVISSFGPDNGMSGPITPYQGNSFAALSTDANAWMHGALSYNITLEQTVSLNNGDIITGQSCFYNGDDTTQDSAWVRVLNSSGATVATLWNVTSGGLANNPIFESATSWTTWDWQASTAGDYTIELGASTQGDDNMTSRGFFDGITTTAQGLPATTSVPEPSSMGILGLGIGGFFFIQRKLKK